MGGPGSGRWPADLGDVTCKETTEDYLALDIREAKRRLGLIAPDQQELPGVARIVWIPAGFGNPQAALRPYFLRPRTTCIFIQHHYILWLHPTPIGRETAPRPGPNA